MTQKLFLGVVGAGLTEACRLELNAGMALHKHMIVMSYPALVPQLQPYFGPNLVEINPASPDGAEIGIVQHLKTINAQQNAKNALLALVGAQELVHILSGAYGIVPAAKQFVGNEVELTHFRV